MNGPITDLHAPDLRIGAASQQAIGRLKPLVSDLKLSTVNVDCHDSAAVVGGNLGRNFALIHFGSTAGMFFLCISRLRHTQVLQQSSHPLSIVTQSCGKSP